MSHNVSLSRRKFLIATPALATAAAAGLGVSLPSRAASADTTLVLGDQAGLLRGLVEASGVLKDAGFKYRWASFQGAAPLFEAQRASAVDVAWGGDLPILAASVGDPTFKIVTTLGGQASSLGLLVQDDSRIRSVADLKGKTVVISSARGSVAQYQLYGALAEAGLKPDDVQVRFVLPTDAAAAFASRQIEVWGTFDPYFGVAQQRGGRVLRDGSRINSGLFFVTAPQTSLADPAKRAALAEYLRRLQQAGAWAKNNPEAYTRIYGELTRVPPEAARLITNRSFINIRRFTDDDVATLQKVSDAASAWNIIPKRIDVKSIAEQSLAA
ncbi:MULTISPECIES: ABC transporter substrate-binding protein [Cupriavidus]